MKPWIVALLVAMSGSAAERGIGRTFRTLRDTGKLSVGYLGGSITAGSGASKAAETSYRALTTKWFRQRFPNAEITEINAAIGGTGSDLGAFRCGKDLLSKRPDLVFVEFAVNDSGSQESRVTRSMEGIVRQIWHANPSADIIFIYTINKNSMGQFYDRGERPPSVIWHERIAGVYQIPSINVGEALWRQVHEKSATWEELLPDNVHPSDKGYAIYGQQIGSYLDAHRNDKAHRPRRKLPKAMTADPFDRARLIDASQIEAEGWQRDPDAAAKWFPHSLAAEAPGTVLTWRFSGTVVGLFWLIAPDSGDVEWSIDGSAPRRASSWDRYALRFTRANYTIFRDNLPPGEHVLTLRVSAEKNPESKGTWLRIGAMLVN